MFFKSVTEYRHARSTRLHLEVVLPMKNAEATLLTYHELWFETVWSHATYVITRSPWDTAVLKDESATVADQETFVAHDRPQVE